jgi:hypothetical protein
MICLQLQSYDDAIAQGFPYEKFNYENKGRPFFFKRKRRKKRNEFHLKKVFLSLDYYQVENDFNEPEFEPAENKDEDF